ncbi:MAG: hypothetical protein B5766_11305 [Candidatus Lumbricidophila eiseniae]|uniref:Uncharacterized protein n=1 Tax=Candidatus Lumbricidiphila eiseniae TaxID=1969409 RepID=A0A2A6FNQ8_9MICO|nr:MAG: hypothetical protein B5766_11305 [Candidatus Lumbricidophila eiseniae]
MFGLPHLPGVATATEIEHAMTPGMSWLKAFPASALANLKPHLASARTQPHERRGPRGRGDRDLAFQYGQHNAELLLHGDRRWTTHDFHASQPGRCIIS